MGYDNHQIELKGDVAFAMGNYYFTCATTGDVSKVEYTFGYQRCDDGKVRIFLHHSSVPYKLSSQAAVTEEDVTDVQNAVKQVVTPRSANKIHSKATGA